MGTEAHNNPIESFDQSKTAGYEVRDANIRALVGFGIGMAVVLFIITVSMIWVFRYYAHVQNLGPSASPFENTRTIPPLPRLQAAPHTDILDYWDSEQKSLNSYGWVDRQKGIAHIPIDEAMRIVVDRGLPTRPSTEINISSEAAAPVQDGPRTQPHGRPPGGSR